MPVMRLARSVSVVVVALASCAQLPSLAGPGTTPAPPPAPPKILVAGVGLAAHPGPDLIARALCPRIAPRLVCLALGGMPTPAELKIGFAIDLDITNPNAIPLPLVEALVAFTVYPGQQGASNLGAVCLSFCDDAASCQPRADACTASGPQIRTMNDFAAASAGFLLATAAGRASPDDLKIKTIGPNQTMRVTVALELDPMQVVAIMSRFAGAAIDQVKQGQVPRFDLPYSLEGSAWVTVQGFGKIAAGFGPLQGVWELH
jgi:hypothetical protein